VLDESTVTGESVPVHREKEAFVRAGTLNTDGFFHFQASAVGEDTSLARIIALIRETGTKKLRISRLADSVSGKFVPIVILLAILTFCIWLLLDAEFSFAITAGIAVLLISCPCALGLATPLAVMAGSGRAAERSILFRSGEALETAGKITAIVFDKTGTLTTGHPTVSAIRPADGITEKELLTLAVSLESGSRHPYAKAILDAGKNNQITTYTCTDFQVIPGRGIQAFCDGQKAIGGNREFLSLPEDATSDSTETQLFFAWDGKYYGSICIHDPLRDDTLATLKILKDLHIKPVMLTGDREVTAKAVAEQCGIAEYKAEVLPEDKENIIRALQNQGEIVAMAGDGINDAPALLRADVGIAVCGGTDIAIDSADVILMRQGLLPAAETVMISRAVVRNIKINLFWAFAYNVLAIPLAAGVFYPLTGWLLPPAAGAAAMCASSLCVVINALRLRYIR
jgi:heavy metal translocating P-type ATPase